MSRTYDTKCHILRFCGLLVFSGCIRNLQNVARAVARDKDLGKTADYRRSDDPDLSHLRSAFPSRNPALRFSAGAVRHTGHLYASAAFGKFLF